MKALSLAFILAFLSIFSIEIDAQASRGISAAGRRMDDFDNQRRKAERDTMQREAQGRRPTKEELQNAARVKTETREDLEGLQESYNEILTKLSGGEVDGAFAIEATARINKYANRLKANIAFPKPQEQSERKPVEIAPDTRRYLRNLCTRIYEFLTNPMMENPNVLNVGAAHSARDLLDAIIALSDSVTKS